MIAVGLLLLLCMYLMQSIGFLYPLSDRQLENLRAVFGRGVKKRYGRRLAGNPADIVNTLAGEFWVFLRFQSCALSRITKSQL